MSAGTGSVSILYDVTCSLSFSANDQGGGEFYSNYTSFKADKVSVKKTVAVADHSTAQDAVVNNRITKFDWEVTVETKLYAQGTGYQLLLLLQSNDLASMTATASGAGFSGAAGVITDIQTDYAGPSTLKFTLKAHGTMLAWGS